MEKTKGVATSPIAAPGLVGVMVDRQDLENLIHYADGAAKILKDAGYEGKATALEGRYMKIADSIAMGGRNHEA